MILDTEQNLAFVHIPHCGGSTLKSNLIQYDRFKVYTPDNVPAEYKAKLKVPKSITPLVEPIDHLPCHYVPEGYDAVTIVKNPYHREVSAYNMYLKFQMIYQKTYFKTFEEYIKFKYLSDLDAKFFQFTVRGMRKDCYWYMYDKDIPLSKFTLKLETIKDVWTQFAPAYGLPMDIWGNHFNRNTPEHLNWRKMYTSELVDIVTRESKKDCYTFGYSFE